MSISRRLAHTTWVLALVTALFATAVTEGFYRSGVALGAEGLYSDIWHRLAGKRYQPQHVALVMVDDPTLNQRPDEPLAFWTPHFAKAVTVLRDVGVKLVTIDFIFSGSPERWIAQLGLMSAEASRTYDQRFREQLHRGHAYNS